MRKKKRIQRLIARILSKAVKETNAFANETGVYLPDRKQHFLGDCYPAGGAPPWEKGKSFEEAFKHSHRTDKEGTESEKKLLT